MAQGRDSGMGSGEYEILKELYGPLTTAVKDTVLKIIRRNRGKGEDKDVSLWAAEQVKNMVNHAANHTAAQVIKADEERKAKERASKEEENLKKAMKVVQEVLKRMNTSENDSLNDHGIGVVKYPWEKKKKLGKGGFGVVYLATDSEGFNFAVKQVERHDEAEAECLREEIACLTKLSHENIVKCFGYAEGSGKIFMYLELMAGSVRDKMDKSESPLDVDLARKYTRDIAKGLVYLHGENIVHRDIKCGNILLDDNDNAKLADMGLSKTHDQETVLTYDDKAGTILWMSPEVMTNHTAGKRSDVWSLGCTVYEMIKFGPPFYELGTMGFVIGPLAGVQAGKPEHRNLIDEDDTFAGSIKSFLKHIFVSLENRPYAKDIAQHKWLLDW